MNHDEKIAQAKERVVDAVRVQPSLNPTPPRLLWWCSIRRVTLGIARLAPVVAWTRLWQVNTERTPHIISIAIFIDPIMLGARWDRRRQPWCLVHKGE